MSHRLRDVGLYFRRGDGLSGLPDPISMPGSRRMGISPEGEELTRIGGEIVGDGGVRDERQSRDDHVARSGVRGEEVITVGG
jgi:hypothetical protein